MKRDDVYYQAMMARDHRFDGKFFVGVKTTGIYCRPICPAKPQRRNVEFFANHLEAERAGYRPCLRCRPESAPLSPAWIGKSAVVQRAVKMIHHADAIRLGEDRFAALFGVTARHLRRLFIEEVGKTPKQLSFENRLNLARKLIVETSLPLSEIAFAAGFGSIRRFNDAFRKRFSKSPGEIRRQPLKRDEGIRISLPYRPPFDFAGLLKVYSSHRVGLLERFADGKMHRLVGDRAASGWVSIVDDPENSRLLVEIEVPETAMVHSIVAKTRALFDLDSDPVVIANAFERDRRLRELLKKHPGIRLPSGWDPFETAVATILGQLVSVSQGRALVADLIEMLGEDSGHVVEGKPVRFFPSPRKIAEATLTGLKTTSARKKTLIAFAGAVADRKISLEPTQDVAEFTRKVRKIPGIGPWSASYMALRVLRHTDAFPGTDLILARALEIHRPQAVEEMSPWRGYVAALFWREYAESLKKRSGK